MRGGHSHYFHFHSELVDEHFSSYCSPGGDQCHGCLVLLNAYRFLSIELQCGQGALVPTR